ncbi:MAG: orotidine 5'-phosphate decarboxylase / HUMPS family protein [Bacillota bacterium]
MKLQLALDLLDENEALQVTKEVGKYFDIIEVGTSLLKLCGIDIINKIKTICPDKQIFVDAKIIDGPEREATLMYASGTDIFSVLGCSTDISINKILNIANKKNIEVVIDMQSIKDYKSRSKELKSMGIKNLCIHKNKDCGDNLEDSFKEFLDIKELTNLSMSIAGGINLNNIEDIKSKLNPDVVIIGGAIVKSNNRILTAKKFSKIKNNF